MEASAKDSQINYVDAMSPELLKVSIITAISDSLVNPHQSSV
jgi:hypothetical protein